MNQPERRNYLIRCLLNERGSTEKISIPTDKSEQKRLLRGLMNIRPPKPISEEFLTVQDEYLKEVLSEKGVVRLSDLSQAKDGIYLWQGDITRLEADCIVNAANSEMLGCFCPNHGCIDNAIHTYAGVQLRAECCALMKKQGHAEPTGRAKITNAYNLPCKRIIHTVGPIVYGRLTKKEEKLLYSCYRSCLEKAEKNGLKSIAFPCISTGEFHFPNKRAAEIAITAVNEYRKENNSIEVIFNVFKDTDFKIYKELLG